MAVLGFPAGTDWHQPFTFDDEDGTAINLTGVTGMHFVIYQDGTAAFNLTVGSGITVTSAAAGQILVSLTHVQAQEMAGNYLFECYATLASGDLVILERGELHISESYVGT